LLAVDVEVSMSQPGDQQEHFARTNTGPEERPEQSTSSESQKTKPVTRRSQENTPDNSWRTLLQAVEAVCDRWLR
jgi:hypothetical protein